MKILKDIENKLLDRRTVICATEGSKTIKRSEAKKRLAKALGVDEDLVIIKKIHNRYGSNESIIEGKVYNNKEALKKYARPHLVKRNTFVEENKEEAKEE